MSAPAAVSRSPAVGEDPQPPASAPSGTPPAPARRLHRTPGTSPRGGSYTGLILGCLCILGLFGLAAMRPDLYLLNPGMIRPLPGGQEAHSAAHANAASEAPAPLPSPSSAPSPSPTAASQGESALSAGIPMPADSAPLEPQPAPTAADPEHPHGNATAMRPVPDPAAGEPDPIAMRVNSPPFNAPTMPPETPPSNLPLPNTGIDADSGWRTGLLIAGFAGAGGMLAQTLWRRRVYRPAATRPRRNRPLPPPHGHHCGASFLRHRHPKDSRR